MFGRKDKAAIAPHDPVGYAHRGPLRVIVIGAGEVGIHVTKMLSNEGHILTLIEVSEHKALLAQNTLEAKVIQGNGQTPKKLREAEVAKADLLLAVTSDDEANLIACLAAKKLSPNLKTVARVRNSDLLDSEFENGWGMFGIDLVINPDEIAAVDLASAIITPGAVNVEKFADKKLMIAEVIVKKDSPLLGSKLGSNRTGNKYMIAAYMRKGKLAIAYDETILESGDHIFVTATCNDIKKVILRLAGKVEKIENVMIFGATRLGINLAQILQEEGIRVKLLERNLTLAEETAAKVDGVMVLQNDDISEEFLVEEGGDDVHAFISCTDDDAINLITALNAKKIGAHLAFSVLSRASYLPLIDSMDIDAALSPRMHTAAAILRFIRRGHIVSVQQLDGGAEMLEFEAEAGCKIVHTPLRDAKFPRECCVSAIVRNSETIFPKGDDEILPGDHVLIFALPEVISELEELFSN